MNVNSNIDVSTLVNWIMMIVRAGCLFRIAYCIFLYFTNFQENAIMKKRAIHTLFFWIIAECLNGLANFIQSFYS